MGTVRRGGELGGPGTLVSSSVRDLQDTAAERWDVATDSLTDRESAAMLVHESLHLELDPPD